MVIFTGDFNYFSFDEGINNLFHQGLIDTNEEFAFTNQIWKPILWGPPMSKIDYILSSPQLNSVNSFRCNVPNSDHLAVVSDIKSTE
ncbi:MAG: hypothetical protein GY827_10690 [Cytophagales bacterium]|nr:hypothetical protein [Cytophagales bacterium]